MFQSLLPRPARCLAAISRGVFALLLSASCVAQSGSGDLSQMNLEQLAKIQVTSASKKEQKLGDTSSAVYVITQQDIRNSGAASLPEVLRMVPGLDVAQINGNRREMVSLYERMERFRRLSYLSIACHRE